ncbi:MAG: hypothetical protein BVN32_14445 [Proteobacteria bacterium ST_bin14]|nr:MAG: hypothetical protein BVN32_14445 [Proteobacteria bacterium ST_bin14]
MSGQRILALVTDAFGGYGGIAQYNRDLFTALSASAVVDDVVVLPRMAPEQPGTLPAKIRQAPAVAGRIAYSLAAVRHALSSRPTIVFCGHLFHIGLARLVARLTGAKLIVQLHGIDIWSDIAPPRRRALESADLILTVSRDTRSHVRAKTSIDPTKIVILNNTVSDDFRPGDRASARSHFGLGDELAILTVSRLDMSSGPKGHDRIIPLIAALRDAGVPVVYLVAGVGPYQKILEDLVCQHGVERNVRFLGYIQREAQPDLYRAADIFALPSTYEGFGIVFTEAMACGTPTIGLAVGGAPDALGDGELGMCVAPEAFADAFLAMASTPVERDLSLADRVRARFGFPVFSSQVDTIIHTLAATATNSSKGSGG